jgi:plasmid stabilization system protein ParE
VRKIVPSRTALADFDAIYDFVGTDNPRAAAGALRALDHAIQLLVDQPMLADLRATSPAPGCGCWCTAAILFSIASDRV